MCCDIPGHESVVTINTVQDQGDLEGGRNCVWYGKDVTLLCLPRTNFLTPAQPKQAKRAVNWIHHFLCQLLLIELCMLSILL